MPWQTYRARTVRLSRLLHPVRLGFSRPGSNTINLIKQKNLMYDTVSYYSDTATDQRKIRWLEDIELKHCVKHEIDEIELKHCASSKTSVKSSRKY
jgi:hypothetical protein